MGSRYFFITFLPPLLFDTSPELSLHEIDFFLRLNLSSKEIHIVNQLYMLHDIENIRLFLLELPMRAIGTIFKDDLRERLHNDECPLPCLEPFFTRYPTLETRKQHIGELSICFFKQQPLLLFKFVRQYFWIEHVSRLILAHLRAKDLGMTFDLAKEELEFDINDAATWPDVVAPLLSIWQSNHHSASDLEEAMAQWKFETIGSLCADSPLFSLDHILAYLLQLHLLESRRGIKNPHVNIEECISRALQ